MTRPANSEAFSTLLPVVITAAMSLCLAMYWAGVSPSSLFISAVLVGTAVGLRYRVHILLLTNVLVDAIALIVPLVNHDDMAEVFMFNVLIVHVAHQFGYLFGVASSQYVSIAERNIAAVFSKLWDRNTGASTSLPDTVNNPHAAPILATTRDHRPTSPISLTPTGELLNAIDSLSRAVSVDAILEITRSSARKLIGSDGVALILADGDQCHYVEEDAVGPLWKGRRFKMTECISGWSMMNSKTAVIEDISTDERIPYHLYADTFVRSLVMTPVGVDRPVGALGAYWASPYQPTDYEIETVKILARAMAAAINNTHMISLLSQALKQSELKQAELRHRAENAYYTAQCVAYLSLASEGAELFATRLAAHADMQEAIDTRLALQSGIDIRELMQSELQALGANAIGPIKIDGPSLVLDRAQAIALGVAIHDLAANALRHGVQGRLAASWRPDPDWLVFEWRQQDRPEAHSGEDDEGPESQSLRRLIENQLGGAILHRLGEDNDVTCEIRLPRHEIRSQPVAAALSEPSIVWG